MEKLNLNENSNNNSNKFTKLTDNNKEKNNKDKKEKISSTYNDQNDDMIINTQDSLLGKKVNKYKNEKKRDKSSHNKKPKTDEDKMIKSITKMSMEDKNKKNYNNDEGSEMSSEYDDDDESSIYESVDSNDDDYEEMNVNDLNKKNNNKNIEVSVWDEKNSKLKKDEEIVFDNSSYEMIHRSRVQWPCFTLDWIVPEYFIPQPIKNFYNPLQKFINPDSFPYSVNFIAGTQTTEKNGCLYYMKWFNMHKTLYDEDPDREADSESEGAEPMMEHIEIPARGNVNKVKSMKNSYIAAYWSDLKTIELIDLRNHYETMENRWQDEDANKNKSTKKRKVDQKDCHVKSFKKRDEGFALDFSNFKPGVFAAGGYENQIEIHIPVDELCSDYTGMSKENSSNIYDYRTKWKGHSKGVECIVFSPDNQNTLVSSGNDKAIRIWDLRLNNDKERVAAVESAHLSDVNCVDWKISTGIEMIASGGDDCAVKLWDPRKMSNSKDFIANIEYHKEPITALSWDPLSPCQLSVTSQDNRLTIWDFSVEPDEQRVKDLVSNKDIPDQLVFLHQGQENLKDVKYHPYYDNMLISTAEDGINIFKPNFNGDEENEEDDFTFNN